MATKYEATFLILVLLGHLGSEVLARGGGGGGGHAVGGAHAGGEGGHEGGGGAHGGGGRGTYGAPTTASGWEGRLGGGRFGWGLAFGYIAVLGIEDTDFDISEYSQNGQPGGGSPDDDDMKKFEKAFKDANFNADNTSNDDDELVL